MESSLSKLFRWFGLYWTGARECHCGNALGIRGTTISSACGSLLLKSEKDIGPSPKTRVSYLLAGGF